MKKNLALASVLSGALLLSACATSQAGDTTMDDGWSSSSDMTQSSDASGAGESDVRIIDMTVSNFVFTPNVIRIAKGEKVQIRLTSLEGSHGFGIQGMNINVKIGPGETQLIDIPTDTAGTFAFFCSVPCGPGHKEMKGEIIIE